MTVPKLTLTMLGASGSGKTAYLHGMYNRLSMGVQGYYLYATDPDLDLDLAEDWARLRRTGAMPKATSERPIGYEFVFRRGMRDLMTIDCVDFRGNAALDRRSAAEDVALLEDRLSVSDSIILALDSEHVAEWVRHGAPGGLDRDDDPMEISRFSRAISRVFSNRLAEGEPVPGVTVLLTKADLLAERTGMRAAEALQTVGRNFPKLVPVLAGDGADGVTVALCAVQLGNFGAAAQATVDASRIAPKNLHLPVIFSLRHYLSEGIVRNRQEMGRLSASLDASRGELAALSQGFLGGFFKGAEKTNARQQIDRLVSSSSATAADLQKAQERCRELDDELRGIAIYRDGRLLTD
ncbi:hypothetical protein ACFCX4_24575 [Kitasatospora sp. NPDC056327]|uniref:hypothetical protein n=1 Tax=Kitasatospora sp. NPDC056327 TaxID=3345785 RepID=UPI0035E33999